MSDLPRVAFLLPRLAGGGAERNVISLSAAFSAQGYRTSLIAQVEGGELAHTVPETVQHVILNQGSTFRAIFSLYRWIKKERPAAVMSALDSVNIANAIACRLAKNTRSVISMRTYLSGSYENPNPAQMKRLKLMRRWYPKADAIVGVSKEVTEDAIRLLDLPAHKCHTIYNPVLRAELFENAEQKVELPSGPYALTVGRLTPQKQIKELIQNVSFPHPLLILGEGKERNSIQNAINASEQRDRIHLLGFQDNPYPYMKNAHVVLLASRLEGLPTVLVEAMALGTPVIAFDCRSGPKELLNDGEYGDLIPLNDWQAFNACVQRRMQEPKYTPNSEAFQEFQEEIAYEKYRRLMLPCQD
jgi:glycosyltransferase involved in cell wall biosynthesis